MRKYFIAIPSFICVLWIALAAYSQPPAADRDDLPEEYQKVVIPLLPDRLDFAGEEVPLQNFDTRESLRREMLATLYMHSRTSLTLLNTRRYFDVIDPILSAHGIPADFRYLCMAESGLNPEAVSSAGAAGLWQIMKGTAKDYGLETGPQVDERYHLEKSTEAACKYLIESYERFGSWTLAAASYNIGKEGLSRRIEKQGTASYYDTYLPQETLRYVFRILTFKLISEDPVSYGYMIAEGDYYPPLRNWQETQVSATDIVWPDFAAQHNTNYKMLRQLNPWIRDYEFANKDGKTYNVKIPGPDFRNGQLGDPGEKTSGRRSKNRNKR